MVAHPLQSGIFAFLLLLALMAAAPVGAQAPDDHSSDQATVELDPGVARPLIKWIAGKTGWTVLDAPSIRVIPHAELVKMFTGGKETFLHVLALYAHKDRAIYLPNGWRGDDLLNRSALLHELVHHLQNLNHVERACPSASEWQAFGLQIAWLREQGVEDPLSLMGVNALTILLLSQCPFD